MNTNKNFVVDTNIIMADYKFFEKFKNNTMILTEVLLEELDKHKKDLSAEGYNVRQFVKIIDKLRSLGNLSDGVVYENVTFKSICSSDLDLSINDNKIINVASLNNFSVLTNDINMRLKCDTFKVDVEGFNGRGTYDFYTGHEEIVCVDSDVDDIYSYGKIKYTGDKELFQNQYVTLLSENNDKKQALTMFNNGELVKINEITAFGSKGLNRQQKYALALMMNKDIPIVAINSEAGTGKSFLAVSAALELVLERREYEKILYIKPLVAMGGEDIGFLPDSKINKLLNGYSGTLVNILENIFEKREKSYVKSSYAEDLIEKGVLQVEAPTYMRGMSYPNTIMIIDECENISVKDIKNICTRCGKNSKIFLLGDGKQTDVNKLDEFNNGLQHVIDKLKGQNIFGTVKLDKSVRSDVAQICVDLL
jgi:PhoH-like ATPase